MKKKSNKVLKESGVMYFEESFSKERGWITLTTCSSVKEVLDDCVALHNENALYAKKFRVSKFVRVDDTITKLAS
jgi:hypothetical protein